MVSTAPPPEETVPATDAGHLVCRVTDPASGVVVEMRTDGVPVGLALPPRLLEQSDDVVIASVLHTLAVAGADARALLEHQAEEYL